MIGLWTWLRPLLEDDPEKMALMRSAIEEGFQAAKNLFGGEPPDISNSTYDLIQEKLDAWEQESR